MFFFANYSNYGATKLSTRQGHFDVQSSRDYTQQMSFSGPSSPYWQSRMLTPKSMGTHPCVYGWTPKDKNTHTKRKRKNGPITLFKKMQIHHLCLLLFLQIHHLCHLLEPFRSH